MTIEQRKIDLISCIASLDNESLLLRMQELIDEEKSSVPLEIMTLLDKSNTAKMEERIEHSSVRELIKK